MGSPMIEIFRKRDRRNRMVSYLWTAFFGITLIMVLIALGLAAVESLPDPKQPVTHSVTPTK